MSSDIHGTFGGEEEEVKVISGCFNNNRISNDSTTCYSRRKGRKDAMQGREAFSATLS